MSAKRPVKGKWYRLVKPCASLYWWESIQGGFRGRSLELEVGDRIQYVGTTELGSDSVPEDVYITEDGTRGRFSPAFWGSTDMTYLSDIIYCVTCDKELDFDPDDEGALIIDEMQTPCGLWVCCPDCFEAHLQNCNEIECVRFPEDGDE